MGVVSEPMKGGESKKRGCRPNAQRIKVMGRKLVASGQLPMIADVFKLINKVNS